MTSKTSFNATINLMQLVTALNIQRKHKKIDCIARSSKFSEIKEMGHKDN